MFRKIYESCGRAPLRLRHRSLSTRRAPKLRAAEVATSADAQPCCPATPHPCHFQLRPVTLMVKACRRQKPKPPALDQQTSNIAWLAARALLPLGRAPSAAKGAQGTRQPPARGRPRQPPLRAGETPQQQARGAPPARARGTPRRPEEGGKLSEANKPAMRRLLTNVALSLVLLEEGTAPVLGRLGPTARRYKRA
jgi:hypothetical protein